EARYSRTRTRRRAADLPAGGAVEGHAARQPHRHDRRRARVARPLVPIRSRPQMNPTLAKTLIQDQAVQPSPTHGEATANIPPSPFKTPAHPLARLPLEAEPAGYLAEQRREAP